MGKKSNLYISTKSFARKKITGKGGQVSFSCCVALYCSTGYCNAKH
jgi:hypothetical protein